MRVAAYKAKVNTYECVQLTHKVGSYLWWRFVQPMDGWTYVCAAIFIISAVSAIDYKQQQYLTARTIVLTMHMTLCVYFLFLCIKPLNYNVFVCAHVCASVCAAVNSYRCVRAIVVDNTFRCKKRQLS